MDELISRRAAIDALLENVRTVDGYCVTDDTIIDKDDAIKAINNLPSAQRKGKWYSIGNTGLATCKCGYITDRHSVYNYCPKCGAEMKGEEDVRKPD